MTLDKIARIFMALIIVAGVTSVLMRGTSAARVITAIWTGFTGAIRASMGN